MNFPAPRCDNARGHGTKGMARLFLNVFPSSRGSTPRRVTNCFHIRFKVLRAVARS
nr:MAG TPA: hypothetical protein [Caudoviricetes sp.]DAQ78898.1 MAG TPA: hypothetical protein [Caudoviricetes sp.]DAU52771.1 MAG TPA: hypothetical protein [Caudoviricetes sp.]